MKPTTIQDVDHWLSILERLAQGDGQFKAPDFLRPFHLLMFAIILKKGPFKRLNLDPKLGGYANRMRLWEAAGLEPPHPMRARNPSGRFCPVTALNRQTVQETTSLLTSLVAPQASDEATQNSLEITIAELLENCYAHAPKDGELLALAAAQAWFKGSLAQIAIADAGMGIRSRLMNNPRLHTPLASGNACELATRYGVTADPAGGHSGYGLTLAKDILAANGGSLMLISGDEMVTCSEGGVASRQMPRRWNGTVVIFEWKTDRTLDAPAVYKNWPTPEGFDDDEFM